jgi:hypothetical protein
MVDLPGLSDSWCSSEPEPAIRAPPFDVGHAIESVPTAIPDAVPDRH